MGFVDSLELPPQHVDTFFGLVEEVTRHSQDPTSYSDAGSNLAWHAAIEIEKKSLFKNKA